MVRQLALEAHAHARGHRDLRPDAGRRGEPDRRGLRDDQDGPARRGARRGRRCRGDRCSWTVAEADALHRRLVADLGPYRGDTWPKGTTTAIAALRFPQLYGSGANELRLAQDQVKPPVPAELQALRIGDLLISGSPGELYNELGQSLKQQVGPAHTWVASFCNDYVGYISTRKPHDEIAAVPVDEIVDQQRYRRYYGTTTSPFAPDAGERLVDAAARLVEGLG